MDPIIDKINEIEHAASRILEEAARTNRELDAAHEVRIKAADVEVQEETDNRLAQLQQELESRRAGDAAALEAEANRLLAQLDAYYQASRETLADSLFDSIIRK